MKKMKVCRVCGKQRTWYPSICGGCIEEMKGAKAVKTIAKLRAICTSNHESKEAFIARVNSILRYYSPQSGDPTTDMLDKLGGPKNYVTYADHTTAMMSAEAERMTDIEMLQAVEAAMMEQRIIELCKEVETLKDLI